MTATPRRLGGRGEGGRHAEHLDAPTTRAARRGTSRWGSAWCGCTTGPVATTRSPGRSTSRACSPTGTCPRTTTTAGKPHDARRPDATRASGRPTTESPSAASSTAPATSRANGKVPTVTAGQSITFDNLDAADQDVWHSITACKAPCTTSTGIAYPLADADVQFDSGQLGDAGPPTSGSDTWTTPADLTPARTPTSAASTPSCAVRSASSPPIDRPTTNRRQPSAE